MYFYYMMVHGVYEECGPITCDKWYVADIREVFRNNDEGTITIREITESDCDEYPVYRLSYFLIIDNGKEVGDYICVPLDNPRILEGVSKDMTKLAHIKFPLPRKR